MLEREMLWRFLTGKMGAIVGRIGMADSQLSRINPEILQIRVRYADKLRIEDLANAALMSVPTFHRYFQAVTGMSPLRFHIPIRIREARQAYWER